MASAMQQYFDGFLDNIVLRQSQVDRIESASGTLQKYLRSYFDLTIEDVFLQGSYANGTAVRPIAGGEYDVDVVCVSASATQSADSALDELFAALDDNGNYSGKLVAKKPCIRIEYADDDIGKFHVDVVPVRLSSDAVAPLDAPRRGNGWHCTAPQEYTQWCADQGEDFRRTVQMLKRWRDEQQDVRNAIKSIVLQVLISDALAWDCAADDERILRTLENLQATLAANDAPPVVSNPVLPSENLAARWTATSYADFKRELAEAVTLARRAYQADDAVESAETWRELFGEAFPLPKSSAYGVQLADTSHALHPSVRGWYIALDPRYRVRVTAEEQRGRRGKLTTYPNDGPLLFAGKNLRFQAHVTAPSPVELWWRITNTGSHARTAEGLRGDFVRARKLNGQASPRQDENWERTAYTGTHLVEVFALSGARVVALSEPFRVNIYKKGRSWSW